MKQCLVLVTVGKMGIKFNFVLNPVRFKLTRLLLQFILALIGVFASERFQIVLQNSKKKKERNLIYHKRMWKARQTKKQPKQQENKLQSKTNRYTIRKKVKGK